MSEVLNENFEKRFYFGKAALIMEPTMHVESIEELARLKAASPELQAEIYDGRFEARVVAGIGKMAAAKLIEVADDGTIEV